MTGDHIFGYGSLVNTESRNKTGSSTFVGAARVAGLQRAWNVRVTDKTPLGVILSKGATCNGVIVSVSPEELAKFDERELPEKYERVALPASDISFLDSQKPADGRFWVYITRNPEPADREHPILQSYLDVVLTGFLEYGFEFAKEFIDSTTNWSYIENDRVNPRYKKHLEKVERKEEIDQLMKLI